MNEDEIFSESLHTESNELAYRLFAISDKENWLTHFERTVLDSISKNLHQLTSEIAKLETILENSIDEDIDSYNFEYARNLSLDSCRKMMGNLEILPNPSDVRKCAKK